MEIRDLVIRHSTSRLAEGPLQQGLLADRHMCVFAANRQVGQTMAPEPVS